MKKRHSAEQIVAKLRQANIELDKGLKLPEGVTARQISVEALVIRRTLAAEMPDAHLADMGNTLSNSGMLLDDLRDFNGAAHALCEAIAIRRSLAQAQPSVFNPVCFTTYQGMHKSSLDDITLS